MIQSELAREPITRFVVPRPNRHCSVESCGALAPPWYLGGAAADSSQTQKPDR